MYDIDAMTSEPLLLEPLRASVERGALPAYLRSAKLKLTARCNLTCVMCKYGRGLSLPELDGEHFRRIVSEMAALGCRKVHFSGGEVLTRKDFESILGRAADEGMKVTFTSNLTLMTKERAKAVMHHKVSSISTSLDGASAKVHEAVRGIEGSFRRTLRALSYLARERERRGRRTRLRVNFVMMRRNFRDYPALVRLCHEHGVTELHPMPVDEKVGSGVRLSRRLIREYNDEIAPRVLEERQRAGYRCDDAVVYPFGRSEHDVVVAAEGHYALGYYQHKLCYAPWTHVFVAWDGKVYLCCMTNGRIDPLGDLSRESVADVFLGERFQALRERMKRARLKECHRCDMFTDDNRALDAALRPSLPPPPARLRVLAG